MTDSTFCGNATFGLQDETDDGVTATNDYWGDPSGPTATGNPAGEGEAISGDAVYTPFSEGDDAVFAIAECALAVSCFEDLDGDGQGSTVAMDDVDGDCDDDAGQSSVGTDCDDTDADVFLGAIEACNGGVDDDCDGLADDADTTSTGRTSWYGDGDSDGFGDVTVTVSACAAPSGYVGDATDCDDADAGTSPGAAEVCDGEDDDCDGTADEGVEITWYEDVDGDGYGVSATTFEACTRPTGFAAIATDCDDADALEHPGATEQCDGLDNDCDGTADDGVTYSDWYADIDGDGFGDPSSTAVNDCLAPTGTSDDPTDCDDGDPFVRPSGIELCNGTDDDCDTVTDEGDAADAPPGTSTTTGTPSATRTRRSRPAPSPPATSRAAATATTSTSTSTPTRPSSATTSTTTATAPSTRT